VQAKCYSSENGNTLKLVFWHATWFLTTNVNSACIKILNDHVSMKPVPKTILAPVVHQLYISGVDTIAFASV
jgi:hypothetical protein